MTRPSTTRRSLADVGPDHPRWSPTRHATLVALLVCLAAMTGTLRAQQPAAGETPGLDQIDQRWLPWLGCWQLVEETGALAEAPDDRGPFADRVVVCLTPRTGEADEGIEVTTVADGEPVLVETLLADGVQHQIEETACTGWRHHRWSRDGARLFTLAELDCGDADIRRASGVGLMTGATTWLDIELVATGERGVVTVRRYRRASDRTTADAGATALPADLRDRVRAAARLASTSELSIEDVIEAHQAIEPAVVEAMLIETRAAFVLDRHALIELDDSGVSTGVIDLVVALAFPDQFVVNRSVGRTTSSYGGGGGFANAFSPYGFNSWYPYYASPFGYYYGWSPYRSLYYSGPAASYVIGQDPGTTGRAYSGRGYARIDAREPGSGPVARRRGTTGTGTRSTQATSRGGRNSGGNSGGSSGGGQATSGGYSRGGGSSGRTAVPRDR